MRDSKAGRTYLLSQFSYHLPGYKPEVTSVLHVPLQTAHSTIKWAVNLASNTQNVHLTDAGKESCGLNSSGLHN
jgi:hypothetical protein